MRADVATEFIDAMLAERGLDRSLRLSAGVSIVADRERASTGVASGYVLGERFMIWCDPAVADRVSGFEAGLGSSGDRLDRWASFGTASGAEFVGSGALRLPTGDGVSDAGRAMLDAHAQRVVAIDASTAADAARLDAFLAQADPDDIDEADIEIDNPDPTIRCAEASADGSLVSYASARPWQALTPWWDIGVLTLAGHRGRGLGLACVAATAEAIGAAGHHPLYRHDLDNVASAALAERAGFTIVAELAAIRFAP